MDKSIRQAEEHLVKILSGEIALEGNLSLPPDAKGIVAFAHGSGSSRNSPRNRYVAEVLQNTGLATLLFDLLTAEEEAKDARTGHLRFNIGLLAMRLAGATEWLKQNEETRNLTLGYFGASTGAAAALMAATARPSDVGAIVSRGGRPDLAMSVLPKVKAPVLLIVGGDDFPVIGMNREALARLNVEKELVIIPGASHLFEEPGALEQVATHAARWFVKYLSHHNK